MLDACRQVHYFAVTTETFNDVHCLVSDTQHNRTQEYGVPTSTQLHSICALPTLRKAY